MISVLASSSVCLSESESPSSSTPEDRDTEDDGQAVSHFFHCFHFRCKTNNNIYYGTDFLPNCIVVDIAWHWCGGFCVLTLSLCQSHTDSESSSNSRKEMLPKPITIVTSESSAACFVRSAAEDCGYGTGHVVPTQTPAQVRAHLCAMEHLQNVNRTVESMLAGL